MMAVPSVRLCPARISLCVVQNPRALRISARRSTTVMLS